MFFSRRQVAKEGGNSLASLLETFEIFQRTPGKHFRESETLSKHKGDTNSGKHLSRVLCAPSFLSFFLLFFFFSPPVFPLFNPGAEEFKARSRTHTSVSNCFLGRRGKTEFGQAKSGGVYFCRVSCIFFPFFEPKLARSFNDIQQPHFVANVSFQLYQQLINHYAETMLLPVYDIITLSPISI